MFEAGRIDNIKASCKERERRYQGVGKILKSNGSPNSRSVDLHLKNTTEKEKGKGNVIEDRYGGGEGEGVAQTRT